MLAGVGTSRTRVHGGGTVLAVLGACLTGVAVDPLSLGLGIASIALAVASVNVHLDLPSEAFGVTAILAAIGMAALVGGIGLVLANTAQSVGGGGLDAQGGIAAWAALFAAVTWGLVRWARGGTPE